MISVFLGMRKLCNNEFIELQYISTTNQKMHSFFLFAEVYIKYINNFRKK